MLDANTERVVHLTLQHLKANLWVWLLLGLLITAGAMFVGFNLPKQYRAYASIMVEQQRVVGNLMEGVAEQTDATDQASIVRELASSRRLLESMVTHGEFLPDDGSLIEREREMEYIKQRTSIENRGGSLIGIEYADTDPQRAFDLTTMYVDWVISESRSTKRRESQEAYNFIDAQVNEYHAKLRTAEEGLREYRSENMDALPESAAQVVARATTLRREIETLQLETSELRVRERTLVEELSGERAVTNVRAEESAYRARLSALQQELDTLRLSYHDTYPDIVRVKTQIENLQKQMASGAEMVVLESPSNRNNGNPERNINPLYERLRGELSTTRTEIQAKQARIESMQTLLADQIDRSRRIADSEVELAELTRDYEVNRDIYQDLLRRRERAHVSMNLDSEQQGVTMKVQEPPAVPATPTGIRFFHIVAAGLGLVLTIPIVLSAMIVQLDPRIRMKQRLEALNLNVLAVVPRVDTAPPWRRALRRTGLVLGSIALVSLYAGAAWIKLQGLA